MKRILINSDIGRQAAKRAIDNTPDGFMVDIKERTRTADQNALLHALLQDISRQVEWAGKHRSLDDWKALMVSAHRVVLQQAGEVVPGLEGEFVQLRKSTSAMGVKELASLIDYVHAWGVHAGVRFSAPERWSA